MMEPTGAGLVEPRGNVIGGHAYVLNGVNVETGLIRGKNSWGREWGRRGAFSMRISDFDTLLQAQGEACIATEVRP
jgi:aminopeptidase C